MDIIKKKFGEQLKVMRHLKGFTQETLSEKIGINIRQLARIEAGESFIKSDTLYKICIVLDITPGVLFNFDINEELIMTGTDNSLHFNVIKDKNFIKVIPKVEINTQPNISVEDEFNLKMFSMAQKLQRDIFVDELENGVVVSTKAYTPSGELKITNKIQNGDNNLEELKNNLEKIANDPKKLEYMNLAFNSLHNSNALEQLKFLIKGLELTQK